MTGFGHNILGFGVISAAGGPSIGDAFGGGFYAGDIIDNSVQYHLIVSPKASGEHTSKKWKTANSNTSGTSSLTDGPTNSANANTTAHQAAYYCLGLTIDGYDDWYLGATLEMDIIYFNLKPTTTGNNTSTGINAAAVPARGSNYTTDVPAQTPLTDWQTGGAEAFDGASYWCSNQTGGPYARFFSPDNGYMSEEVKTGARYARAIRRQAV